MKTSILASLLALTAVSGTVMLSAPAKAEFNYYGNGLFGHTYSQPDYTAPGVPAAPQAGFDGNDDGSADGSGSSTGDAEDAPSLPDNDGGSDEQ